MEEDKRQTRGRKGARSGPQDLTTDKEDLTREETADVETVGEASGDHQANMDKDTPLHAQGAIAKVTTPKEVLTQPLTEPERDLAINEGQEHDLQPQGQACNIAEIVRGVMGEVRDAIRQELNGRSQEAGDGHHHGNHNHRDETREGPMPALIPAGLARRYLDDPVVLPDVERPQIEAEETGRVSARGRTQMTGLDFGTGDERQGERGINRPLTSKEPSDRPLGAPTRGRIHPERGAAESSTDDEIEHGGEIVRFRPTRGGQAAKLPPFTGQEKWEVWFNRFSDVATRRGWSNEEKLDELLPRMQGTAGEFVFGQLSGQDRTNFRGLTKELGNRFRRVETARTFCAKFSNRKQKPGETVEEYAAELKRLYAKAHGNRDPATREEDLLRRFLDGILDDGARFHVDYVKEPVDIDEAVFQVVHFLETRKYSTSEERKQKKSYRAIGRGGIPDTEDSDDDDRIQATKAMGRPPKPKGKNLKIEFPEGEKGEESTKHATEHEDGCGAEIKRLREDLNKLTKILTEQAQNQHHSPSANNGKGYQGNSQQQPRQNDQSKYQNGGRKPFVCYNCGLEGHSARQCLAERGRAMTSGNPNARRTPYGNMPTVTKGNNGGCHPN